MKLGYLILFYMISGILAAHSQNVVLQVYPNAKNTHTLEWVVTECSYISHFEIERSIDNGRFEVIYTKEIHSYECNGNYLYTYADFPKGYQYDYRVKAYLNSTLPIISEIYTIFYQPEQVEVISFMFITDKIALSLLSRQKNTLTLTITDVSGKIHHKNSFSINAGRQDIELLIDRYSTGIYFVHISDKENRSVYQKKYFLKNN